MENNKDFILWKLTCQTVTFKAKIGAISSEKNAADLPTRKKNDQWDDDKSSSSESPDTYQRQESLSSFIRIFYQRTMDTVVDVLLFGTCWNTWRLVG